VGDDAEISSFDRLFPNQDKLPENGKGLGNLISMPFQGDAGKKGHTLFLDPDTGYKEPYPDQWEVLVNIKKTNEADLDRLIEDWNLKKTTETVTLCEGGTDTPRMDVGAIIHGVEEGGRDEAIFKMACRHREKGLSRDETEILILKMADGCTPPFPHDEALKKIDSAWKYEPSNKGPGIESGIPKMVKGTLQLRDFTKQSWDAIIDKNSPPVIFEGPNGVVSIHKKNKTSKEHLIKEVTKSIIRNRLSHVSNWFEKKGKYKQLEPIPPLSYVCEDMLTEIPPELPYIKRISNYPFYTEDGYLHSMPGYSEKSKCYLELNNLDCPEIPDNPTPEDIKNARIKIYSLTNDFPFTHIAERAHAIALMILPFAREMIDGPTPVHLIEASTPGTGKTLLAEALTIVPMGRVCPAMTEGRSDGEWRKRITAKLINDPPFIFIDNVRRKIDSAALAAATTIFPTWEDRLLGENKMLNLPVNCAWVITGNNPTLSSEMTRRTIRIKMDAGMDHPERRTKDQFKHPDLLPWVKDNRKSLIQAILTMIQAWIKQGRPTSDIRIGSFEEWSAVIGGILKVGGVPGFLENLDDFYNDGDAEANNIKEFLAVWHHQYKSITVGVAELYVMIIENDIPINMGDKSERSQKTKLGQKLHRLKDRHFDIEIESGVKATFQVKAGKKVSRVQQWQLLKAKSVPENIGTHIGTHPESIDIVDDYVPHVPHVPNTRSRACIREIEVDPPDTRVGVTIDRVKGTVCTEGTQKINKTDSYNDVPMSAPQKIGTHGGPVLPKCNICKCADNGKCYHYSYVGKSGKPLPCQIAFQDCPGFMEKSNRCNTDVK